jgi:hypothetical protein
MLTPIHVHKKDMTLFPSVFRWNGYEVKVTKSARKGFRAQVNDTATGKHLRNIAIKANFTHADYSKRERFDFLEKNLTPRNYAIRMEFDGPNRNNIMRVIFDEFVGFSGGCGNSKNVPRKTDEQKCQFRK